MADVVTPFLDRQTFETMFRTLSVPERTLAEMLLKAAAMWIDARIAEAGKPPLPRPPNADPMAVLVSFEVVRDAMPAVPEMAGRTQYTIVTDDRTESGTINAAAGLLDFNDRHRTLLGLSATTGPQYGGMDGDFGHDYPARSYPNVSAVVVGDLP